ncbi:MAG TPA: hypothetical protein VKY31_11655, partial [Terriglobia bacterium]|nr:hypothetical protein [Terriglobia bacterium]
GIGPIDVAMKLDIRNDKAELSAFPRKKGELVVVAHNNSGLPISYAAFCVQAMWRTKGCDFKLWTNDVWQPGEELTWNLRGDAPRGIENALIVLSQIVPGETEIPDPRFSSIKKVYVEPIDGNNGVAAREELIALISNSKRFTVVEDSTLADAVIKGRSELPEVPEPTRFSQVGIYGIIPQTNPAKPPVLLPSLLIHLSLPSADVIWAWDGTKPCTQSKTKCAVDDLARAATEPVMPVRRRESIRVILHL